MKRSRKSIAAEEGDGDEQDEHASSSITDLPSHILIDILSSLSVKTIFTCRCVSKTWLNLLLTPVFAKHHFTRAPTCPLLQKPSGILVSRTFYLVELERDSDVCERPRAFCYDRINMKLATEFSFPKLDGAKKMIPKSTRSLGCKLNIVDSCNGLLCLQPVRGDYPVVIYNPVMGEYITIPTPEMDNCVEKAIVTGLGFSPKTNQYKVLRVLYLRRPAVGKRLYVQVAEIQTVGSGEWRRIGSFSYSLFGTSFPAHLSLRGTSFPAFLNGTLHWFCKDDERADFIVSFDFGDERFRPIPPPPPYCLKDPFGPIPFIPSSSRCFYSNKSKTGMGVLKGSLCLCDASSYDVTDIWVMKDYGVKESWFKEFKIDTSHLDRWPTELCQPIDVLKNGDLLMYHVNNALVSYNGVEFKYFKIREIESKFLAVAHIPSFVSLKDMMGDKVEVLNVSSRIANIKPRKETTEALFLEEMRRDKMPYSDSSSSSDQEWLE